MMSDRYRILFAVLAIAVAGYFMSSAVFLFLLFGIIGFLIYKNADEQDRKFIVAVLVAGFLSRVALAVLFHGLNFLKGYHGISGDDLLYTVKSWGIVYQWEGKPYDWVKDLAGGSPKFGMNPFTYLLAVFYKAFGFHPVSAKIINCILGASIGWLAYLIGSEMFDKRSARIAMLIVTFYPSIMRWSIANLKDPMIIFLFMTCVYVLVAAARHKIQLWKLAALILSALLLYQFTPKLYFFIIAASSVLVIALRAYSMLGSKKARVAVITAAALGLLAASCYFIYIKPAPLIKFIYDCELKQGLTAKADYAGYYFYSGKFMEGLSRGTISLPGLAYIVYKDVVYFMLSPFPWQFTSPERLLAFPQMILWYIVLALSFFGFIKLAVIRGGTAFLTGVLLVIGIGASAMAEGNIGSAFRHRDMFSPIFIIFASTVISDLYGPGKISHRIKT